MSVLAGLLFWFVSGCCFVSDGLDETPLVAGVVVAACAIGAAIALWRGSAARFVWGLAAVPAAVAFALSFQSPDLSGGLLLLPGWIGLFCLCQTKSWRQWLGRRDRPAAGQ